MSVTALERTPIPGLLVLRLDVHRDERGWFEEAWQRERMTALGLPDFGPVQANVTSSTRRGATRGMHAEPWDKLVTLTSGRAYAAWADLRAGDGFGTTYALELAPGTAVFVPRGVANGYQTLTDDTTYAYLVNDHWRPDLDYLAVNLADPALAIAWPFPESERVLSERDRTAKPLAAIEPLRVCSPLVIGGAGQVGTALMATLPGARGADRAALDITDRDALEAWPWGEHDVVLNAAAYTRVDDAETPHGRRTAWAVNAAAPAALASLAAWHRFTLVHYSTDYVYDGSVTEHDEDEPLAPLGAYGQSKAAGDLAVATAPRCYILRTSWLVGSGPNFVRTMVRLADEGATPSVVSDQVGRLTFVGEVARATRHLLDVGAPYGTYHVSNTGPEMSWADVAREVFAARGRDPQDVRAVSTAEYAAGRPLAARPAHSLLSLRRLEATGFAPREARTALRDYVAEVPRP